MIDLIIVRHGNTFDAGDTITRVGGQTDLPLSRSGIEQAEALGRHFRAVRFNSITTSPLSRTRQTAESIAKLNDRISPALQTASFLREIDYGPDENRPEDEVVARIGQAALDRWDQDAIMPDEWSPRPGSIHEGWRDWLGALRASATHGSVHLIVTSNGIARFALDELNLESRPDRIKLKTGAFGHFRLHPEKKTEILAWNTRPD